MKFIKKTIKAFFITIIFGLVIILGVNTFVVINASSDILDTQDYSTIEKADCIIILGASISNGKPSPILEDRLLRGIELYNAGISEHLLLSGDHRENDYDEVTAMKNFAVSKGVPKEDIMLDHLGVSTYDSIYRAKKLFNAKKIVIVTQKYHLFRAVYIANQLGLDACGVTSDLRSYDGRIYREIREVLARDKDFIKCIYKPSSEFRELS